LGFEPSLTWHKQRNGAQNHLLIDSVRGIDKYIKSDTKEAEATNTTFVTSFDSDGFTVGNNSVNNGSGETNVAWNWKANGSGVSNTDGDITSTVSANTTAGFSIVSYSGTRTSAGNDTIGHGLGVAPSVVISKSRNTTGRWVFQHASLASDNYLQLNTTAADANSVSVGAGSLPKPTSSVFYGSYLYGLNVSGENNIAYCFADVEGYSKFGSYTGNGSSDGPFVYTGFRPAFVIVKRSSSSGSWYIHDSKREGYNGDNDRLQADQSDAEYSQDNVDILSNGFKLITNSSFFNGSGNTFIYMAFAESPFKYSNAR